MMDDLLADEDYLLYADVESLTVAAYLARVPNTHDGVWLLRQTPQARHAAPAERIAMFSVTEVLEGLGTNYRRSGRRVPYLAQWASNPARPRNPYPGVDGVSAVCPVTVNGRVLLASGGKDGRVQIWDPATGGDPIAILKGHEKSVRSVCPLTVNGRNLLASASDDLTVRIWDPATGRPATILHRADSEWEEWDVSVCPVTVNGRELLASGSTKGAVRIWDPAADDNPIATFPRSYRGWVYAVCPVTVNGRDVLASAGNDGMVRIWDPSTEQQLAASEPTSGRLHAVCPIAVNGRVLLASGGPGRAVRIWDPATGRATTLEGHQSWISSVCPVTVNGRELLASGSHDSTVRIWDPATRICQRSIPVLYQVNAICEVAGFLAIGLDAGPLVITLSPGA